LAAGKSPDQNIQNICQDRWPEPRTETAASRIGLLDHNSGVRGRIPTIRKHESTQRQPQARTNTQMRFRRYGVTIPRAPAFYTVVRRRSDAADGE